MRLRFLKYRSQLLARLHSTAAADFSLFTIHFSLSDAYAVVAAMALGDKSALTQDLRDVYSVTGASHVLALIGLHLGIIYTLLSLFVFRRRWQVLSQVIVILSVWAFVFLVGMSTSVMRSAVMLSVYALLSLGHRDRMSVNTLAFTAIVMLMISPMSLFDVGFQMSYMAVFSILLFIPLTAVRTIARGYLYVRIPDVASTCKMALGHGGSVVFCSDWNGSFDCLLFRTLLLLFPPDELCRDTSSHADTLSFVGDAPDAFARVRII